MTVSPETKQKYGRLLSSLGGMKKAAVAFSGGVDSTLLLFAANEAGTETLALTAVSPLFGAREQADSAAFAERLGVQSRRVKTDPFAVPGFRENPPERCYICKRALFSRLREEAASLGFLVLLDGANADDDPAGRPGMAAAAELGVKSPLRDAGLTKAEIRALSKEKGLGTWNKPALACLATRIPTGDLITTEKLARIDRAEEILFDAGFSQARVRCHGDLARIEIPPEEFSRLLAQDEMNRIGEAIRACGFAYVTLDLEGYRTSGASRLT